MKKILFAVMMGMGLSTVAALAQDQPSMLADASPSIAASAQVQASAQGDKPTPMPPYLAPVPENAHWTVIFKYEEPTPDPAATGDGAASAPSKPPAVPDGFPSAMETVKAGDLRTVALTFVKGAPRQFTCQGDYVLFATQRGPKIMVVDPSHMPYMYYSTGFSMLEGVTIGAATYQETEDYNGLPAFHYKSGDTDVWIDVATMLPLGVKKGFVEATYNFIPTSKKPTLKIPADQAELLEKGIEADKYVRSLR